MSTVLSDRCPKCGRTISYTSEATELQCPCGHRFLVVEFVSERLKLEKAQADSQKARQELAAAEAEKTALQNRLNGTLTALEGILGSQRAEDAKLEGILDSLKADRQTHDAMTALLHALRRDQQSGQDVLSRLLGEVMKRQSGTAEKLTAVQELAARILNAQASGAKAVEQMQKEVLEKIRALDLSLEKMLDLSSDFFAWSRSMQQADVQRLQALQSSSDALLQGQKHMTAKLDSLSQSIDHIQKIIDSGFDQLRKQRLDTLIALYHQATGLQIEREFEKAEDTYRKLLAKGGQDAQDAEVYWRMLLCHYGVEYQEENGKIIPIILRPDLTEPDKMQVRKDLFDHVKTEEQRAYYTERLNKMDFYLDRYRKLRMDKNWQYDVFISVKQNDNGHHTSDSDRASELYFYFKDKPELAAKHLRVFNSRHTPLPKGEEYEPYIITALMSAKLLIVVGSKPEYMNSRWVRNEWQRFQYLQEQDKAKTGKTERRLFCYFVDGMDPEKLPGGLNPNAQGIMGGIKAGDEILDVAEEVFPGPASQSGPFTAQPAAETPEQIADKMKLWLQLGQYQKVLDQYNSLVNTRPEILKNVPWICLDTLCAKNGFRRLKSLASERPDLCADPLYEFAYKYADTALREWLDALWKEEPAIQEKQYPDGRYVGQLINGKRHGKGVMDCNNGNKYDGEWQNDKGNGKGVLYFHDGGRYEGDFVDGQTTGRGVRYYKDGTIYDGEWKDGKRNGMGVLIFADGNKYDGEWKDDAISGKGVCYYPDGNKYEGEWSDDKRNGRGVYSCTNGDKYDGEWKDDLFQNGTLIKADGKRIPYKKTKKKMYLGNKLVHACVAGSGVFFPGLFVPALITSKLVKMSAKKKDAEKNLPPPASPPQPASESPVPSDPPPAPDAPQEKSYPNGKYVGQLVNGKRHGRGVMDYANGYRYDGEWRNDTRHGKGVLIFPDGGKYDGEWKDGTRSGKGVYYYPGGDKYEGEWRDGKRNGKGVYSSQNGDRYEGNWKNGEMVQEQKKPAEPAPNHYAKYLEALTDYVRHFGNIRLTDAQIRAFIALHHLQQWKISVEDVQKDLEGVYAKLGTKKPPEPAPNHYAKYLEALTDYVRHFGNIRLTDAQIRDFIALHHLQQWKISVEDVQKDLEGVYAKLGTKKPPEPVPNHYAKYMEALTDYVRHFGNIRLTDAQIRDFIALHHLQQWKISVEDVQKDLEGVYAKPGTISPSNGTKWDYDRYVRSLTDYVQQNGNPRLTHAQIQEFIALHHLQQWNIKESDVQKNLDDVYAKLGIKASSTAGKKALTYHSALEFWRKYLPAVNSGALLPPNLTSDQILAAQKDLGMVMQGVEGVLGVIHVKHGFLKGNTVLIVTRECLYINTNDKQASPPRAVRLRSIEKAEAVEDSGPRHRLNLRLKDGGFSSFCSPIIEDKPGVMHPSESTKHAALNYQALARAINQLIRQFKL